MAKDMHHDPARGRGSAGDLAGGRVAERDRAAAPWIRPCRTARQVDAPHERSGLPAADGRIAGTRGNQRFTGGVAGEAEMAPSGML
jgi:hypothetical protein